jgi:hypothetical protein
MLFRRRRFLIRPGLQLRLVAASFTHVVLVTGVIAAGLFGPAIVALLANDPDTARAFDAANQILYLHIRFWPVVLLAVVVVGLDSIRISHLIAGPLFRFDRILLGVRAGRIPAPIRLRRGDLLGNECKQINATLLVVRDHLQEVEQARERLLRAIERARAIAQDPESKELREVIGELVNEGDSLADITRRFEVERREPMP